MTEYNTVYYPHLVLGALSRSLMSDGLRGPKVETQTPCSSGLSNIVIESVQHSRE